MTEFVEGFISGIKVTSGLEWLAVVLAIAYVIFAAKEMIICWLFALLSSSIFVYLCLAAKLYVESVLNLFYVVMAIVGFIFWNQNKNKEKQIVKWPMRWHLANIFASLFLAVLLGFLLSKYTDQAEPYVDSFTTVFALVATFMVSKKELNNWLYWIVIDAVSVYLYGSRQLELIAVLNILYIVLASYAWLQWRKKYTLQNT